MTRQTMELANCFKRTAQAALKSNFGFAPQRLATLKFMTAMVGRNSNLRLAGMIINFILMLPTVAQPLPTVSAFGLEKIL